MFGVTDNELADAVNHPVITLPCVTRDHQPSFAFQAELSGLHDPRFIGR